MYKYLLLAILGVALSCNNDDDSFTPTADYLVIGDSSADLIMNSTVDMPYWPYDDYEVDLDDDGTSDFKYHIGSSPSMTSGFKRVSISTLHSNALFISNDSIISPEVLNVGDTLRMTNNAIESETLDYYGTSLYFYDTTYPPTGGGSTTIFGLWNGTDHKNVGLMVKKDDVIVYGWTELSIDNDGLHIHKVASKPCLY